MTMTLLNSFYRNRFAAAIGILYFIAIPSFALVYSRVLIHQFYASNVRLEPAARADSERIAAVIKQTVLISATRISDALGLPTQGSLADEIMIDEVSSDDGKKISFRMTVFSSPNMPFGVPVSSVFNLKPLDKSYSSLIHRRHDPTSTPLSSALGIRLEAPYPLHWLIFYADGFSSEKIRIINNNHSQTSMPMLDLFTDASASSNDSRTSIIDFSYQDSRGLQDYMLGMSGDASNVSGSFIRFLYFSAIVITTVGLGDIVPLTPLARLVVGIEAVLGIVLSGAFLNFLFNRPRDEGN